VSRHHHPERRSESVYYWEKQPNFGDALNVPLLEHFAHITAVWDTPDQAHLAVIGSVLHSLPASGWTGVVAGAGMISDKFTCDLTSATVLGLRGPRTVEQVKLPSGADYVLGDPALLASELVHVRRRHHPIGVVPHWSDQELYLREFERSIRGGYPAPVLIDPAGPPLEVIRQIGECHVIVTSSLHGAIVADSFGIPRRIEQTPAMKAGDQFEQDFKWRDHNDAIGLPLVWGERQKADEHVIFRKQAELFDMLKGLKRDV
jgi:pyruvyltransferase